MSGRAYLCRVCEARGIERGGTRRRAMEHILRQHNPTSVSEANIIPPAWASCKRGVLGQRQGEGRGDHPTLREPI